jgi:hypothetical protein
VPPAAVFFPQGVRITVDQISCEIWPDQSWISETQARVSVAEKVLDSFRPARLGIRRAGSRRFSKWIDLTHSLVKEPGDLFRCRAEARQLVFTPSRQVRVSGSEKPADSSILGNTNPKGKIPWFHRLVPATHQLSGGTGQSCEVLRIRVLSKPEYLYFFLAVQTSVSTAIAYSSPAV